jgi:hypothetical protein
MGVLFSKDSDLPFSKDRIRSALLEVAQQPPFGGGTVLGNTVDAAVETFLLRLGSLSAARTCASVTTRGGRGGGCWAIPVTAITMAAIVRKRVFIGSSFFGIPTSCDNRRGRENSHRSSSLRSLPLPSRLRCTAIPRLSQYRYLPQVYTSDSSRWEDRVALGAPNESPLTFVVGVNFWQAACRGPHSWQQQSSPLLASRASLPPKDTQLCHHSLC